MDAVGPQLVFFFLHIIFLLLFASSSLLSASLLSFSLYNFLFFSPLSLCPFMFVYVSKLYHSPYFLLLFPFILFIPLHLWSLLKSFGLSSLLTLSGSLSCYLISQYIQAPIPHRFRNMLFSHSVVSDYLQLHGLHHARLPCPSLSSRACSNLYPLSQWCHPTISSSAVPFSSRLQSFPASGSFPMSHLFSSGDKRIGASVSASVLPMIIQGWFPLGLTGFISLQSKGLSRVFSNTIVQKHQFFGTQISLRSNSHIHTWLLEKP